MVSDIDMETGLHTLPDQLWLSRCHQRALQSLQHRTCVTVRLQQRFLSCLIHSAFIEQYYCRVIHYSRGPLAHSPKSGGWQMPNLGLNGTVSFLLNPPLCNTLGSNFLQKTSFPLDSRPAFLTCLAHSTRPGRTKQIHFTKRLLCTAFKTSQEHRPNTTSEVRPNHKILLILFANQASYKVWNHFILI